MSVVQNIADRLRDQDPSLTTRVEGETITVAPRDKDGFPVWLRVERGSYRVGFDGWHEEFESEEEALNCFAFGLSGDCRLKIIFRGSFACRWTVESMRNGSWRENSTTGLLLFPFWKHPHVVYRTNGRKTAAPEL